MPPLPISNFQYSIFNIQYSFPPALTNSQVYERFSIDTNATNLYLEITSSGPALYTVTYDGIGHTGGAAPSAQTKTHGFDLTLSANSGNLAKTGYTFVGWNTAADGSGANYSEGASYSADGDVTLYARWQSAFDAWVDTNGTGSETFSGDANGDGVADGMAWLLGASSAGQSAHALLPPVSENNGDLIVGFKQRKAASRGAAVLRLQYSKDLGLSDPWDNHTVTVPDTSGTVGDVVFTIDPVEGQDYYQVHATIPATAAGGTGRVFVRLSGIASTP